MPGPAPTPTLVKIKFFFVNSGVGVGEEVRHNRKDKVSVKYNLTFFSPYNFRAFFHGFGLPAPDFVPVRTQEKSPIRKKSIRIRKTCNFFNEQIVGH